MITLSSVCARLSVVAVLSVDGAIFKNNISQGSVMTPFRRGGTVGSVITTLLQISC